MGRYGKSARSQTKRSNELIAELMVDIRDDMRKVELGIERRIRERLSIIDPVIGEAATIQDAIIAGSIEALKQLDRANKRYAKNGDAEQLRSEIISSAERLGGIRKLLNESVADLQEAITSQSSAVDVIEETAQELQRMTGSWEATARGVDGSVGEIIDVNPPVEMIEFQRELLDNGYDVLLSGKNRDEQTIAGNRERLRRLIDGD
jgi:hypothetical protein